MFTGLVTAIGTVRERADAVHGLTLIVAADWNDIALGESIAIDGACLTAVRSGSDWFEVQVAPSTLERTNFDAYRVNRRVNLERALRASDRLGGHLVQGHVDGIGTITGIDATDGGRVVDLGVPANVVAVSVPLGSIAVDGVSLTVIAVEHGGEPRVRVSLIPFTLEHTTLGSRQVGDRVHVEGDQVGKYLRQLLADQWPRDRR